MALMLRLILLRYRRQQSLLIRIVSIISYGNQQQIQMYGQDLRHLEDGVPIQYEDRHVNPAVAPDYLGVDFSRRTPTHYLLEHAPLTEASYSIEAVLPDAAQARALGIGRSDPCLRMTRRTLSGTQVASLARLLYPGALYNFGGKFQL